MKLWPTISSPFSEKHEIADHPDQAPAYDINHLTLVCQYIASNCNIYQIRTTANIIVSEGQIFEQGNFIDLFFENDLSLSVMWSAMLRNAYIVQIDNV